MKPAKDAMKLHPFFKGKIETFPKCVIRDFDDFAIWYTPGVAEPCKDIAKNPEKVYEYTNKGNLVGVITDGSRVLGLGNIGPEAGYPVMEGKALLFKYLGGVDVFPICLGTQDPDEFIVAVKWLQPSFGGINLEDIAMPKCFRILNTLRRECTIPVWHDDQQGTAAVTVAGLVNALKIVNKKIDKIKVSMIGAGASNICIARLMIEAGVEPGHIYMTDSKGLLHKGRAELKEKFIEKWHMCEISNEEQRTGGIAEAMENTDACVALSTPGPGVIKKEWVSKMSKDAIVFACANPIPEIWPWEAKDAGARIVATGRSDFPNQVNNSLGFPGIFRGALDVRASTITDQMCLAASYELARCAQDKGLREDYLIPTMDDWEVYPREAVAVGMQAIKEKVAGIQMSKEQLYEVASNVIRRARETTKLLMREKVIPAPPK
ncbi:MAG: NADP-dependent malic enzyme [Candidatus Eiseniibacteriota bacterium]|nr:MAG: NADP-dependent malic enzyme [Candidatus Eisenbacteria bacterium]